MARDFDKEKVLEKMRELAGKRNSEILEALEKRNLTAEDKEKLQQASKVVNAKYLGKIDFEEVIDGEKVKTEKDIYLLIEQMLDKDGNLVDIEKYYTGDGEFLAGNNKSDNYHAMMLTSKYQGRDDIIRELQHLKDENALDLNQIERDRLEELAKALGIKPEDIQALSEIDLEQEIQTRKENGKEETGREELDGEERQGTDNGKEPETLTKKQVERISTKSEIKTEEKVTERETMASLLGVEDKGYKKIAVVYSDKLQENGNSTRFSIVGIKEDGSAEKIDTLEIDTRFGNNPTNKVNALNRDGSEIEEQQVQSVFRIKNRKEQEIAIRMGNMGTIETSYVRTDHTQEGFSSPIPSENIKPTTREVREFMDKTRNVSMGEEIDKADELRQNGAKKEDIKMQNINDDPHDDDISYVMNAQKSEKNNVLDNIAKEVLKNDTIAETYNISDVKQHVLKLLNSRKSA